MYGFRCELDNLPWRHKVVKLFIHNNMETTAHGIPNFFRARGRFKSYFWGVAGLVSTFALFYCLVGLVEKYLSYPKNVVISLKTPDKLTFPSVTFCNMNPVKESSVHVRKKRQVGRECPFDWVGYERKCFFMSFQKQSFEDSEVECKKRSATLASITDEDELNFILKILVRKEVNDWWFGLVKDRPGANAQTYFLDGNPSKYRNWGNRESKKGVLCVSGDKKGFYKENDCKEKFYYLCLAEAVTRSTPISPSSSGTTATSPTTSSTTATIPATNTKSAITSQAASPATSPITSTASSIFSTTSPITSTATSTFSTSPTSSATSPITSTPPIKSTTSPTSPTTSLTSSTTSPITSTPPIKSTTSPTSPTPSTPSPITSTSPTSSTTSPITSTTSSTFSTTPPTSSTPSPITSTSPTSSTTSPITSTTSSTFSTTPPTSSTTSPITSTTSSTFSATPPTSPTTSPTSSTISPITSTATLTVSTSPTTSPKTSSTTMPTSNTVSAIVSQATSLTTSPTSSPTTSPTTSPSSRATSSTTSIITSTKQNGEASTSEFRTYSDESNVRASTTTQYDFPWSYENVSSKEMKCCCTCCRDSICASSTRDSLDASTQSAMNLLDALQDPSSIVTFLGPTPLNNSRFPGRLALNEEFKKQEIYFENFLNFTEEKRKQIGYKRDDVILTCLYQGEPCDSESDFVEFNNPIHGNCWVFNSGWNENSSLKMATETGHGSGLQVILNIDQTSYSSAAGEVAGVRVVVSGQRQLAFPEDEGITVQPGLMTFISIDKSEVIRLPDPYGDCSSDTADMDRDVYVEIYPVDYRSKACENTCFQRKVIEDCNCSDPFYPNSGKAFSKSGLPICSVSNFQQDECHFGVKMKFLNNSIHCDCPITCREETFKYFTSAIDYPTSAGDKKYIQENWQISEDKLSKNILKLQVYFSNFEVQTFEESPSYEITQLFSDLCGILGLWFGFAFMTFFEYIELVLDILVVTCHSLLSRK